MSGGKPEDKSMTSAKSTHRVLIVGGAISGSEVAAQCVARGIPCVVMDQNAHPYGKIEDGLPRWHVKLRDAERDRIDGKLNHPLVDFLPNTRLGQHVQLEAMLRWGFSAVVLANGAWMDRRLAIPDEEVIRGHGLVYQNEFVSWFNHHLDPDYCGPVHEVQDGALVIGGGLASLDVIKILQLESVVGALEARGIEVDLLDLERWGVKATLADHALTLADLKLRGPTLVYRRRPEDMPVAPIPPGADAARMEKARATRTRLLNNFLEKYQFTFRGQLAPGRALLADGRLTGMAFHPTVLQEGRLQVDQEREICIETPLVISSIGSIPEPIPGLEMHGELYPVADLNTGAVRGHPNLFAVGNAVTGKGNIRVSMKHGRKVSEQMLEAYLEGQASGYEEVFEQASERAQHSAIRLVDWIAGTPSHPEPGRDPMVHIRRLQTRAGYCGMYARWMARIRPGRFAAA